MRDVAQWLEQLGLGQYASVFTENDIDEELLPDLTDQDLKDLGVSLGHRKKLLKATAGLKAGHMSAAAPLSTPRLETLSATLDTTGEAERRQLTVMFCDLVGSTALSKRLDPEELRNLLATYQETCSAVVSRFEGYIARYVGDGLLIYFGYPQAHEDDAQRAVRAGLGIVEAIQALDTETTQPGVTLAVRIGITTGLVVAGDIGSGEQHEEKAIVGETPNLAARLQALAKPNAVVIGISTQRLVEDLFEFDNLGPQRAKGISEPVTAYRVRGESGAASEFEARVARRLTPLVGRDSEIDLLLNRWQQAKDGEGQAVLLAGEAGIGKSRIVRGFQERIADELRNRVLYYGSPYHQNSAFYPAIEQLKRGLRFESNDNPAQKFAKLEAVLDELGLPVTDFAPVLASLLSLPTSPSYLHFDLSPEQLKTKTLKALVSMVEAMALRDPVLMVVEDLHWIDPSTLELISLLVEQLHATRFLLVVTFRHPFERPWSAHAHVTALTLNRLSRKDSAAIIAKMTRGKSLPAEVLEQIVAKTDGMPLFVEELTKTVMESGLLEDAGERYALSGPLPPLAIPASLRDSLMARLDRLASVKEVAQLAATLGRTFGHRLLAAVSLLEARKLDDALLQLVEAELIYRRGLPPDVTYEFKHVLVQDAAYQSLLKTSRQQYHQRIARVLEEQFAETAETEPELLAHHYTEAHLHDQAIRYWQKAGKRASERSAGLEAIAHLAKGLELIKKLPESEGRTKQELGLHLTLGPALMSTKGWGAPEVDRAYLRAQELCRQVGEPSQLFAVTWGLWHHNQHCGNLKMARRLAGEVLSLSEQQSDAGLLLQAHHAAWTTHFSQPELVSCRDHAEKGIALYSFEDHRSHAFLYGGHDPGVCARVHAAAALWLLGFAQQALAKTHDAQRLAEDLTHPHSLAQALSYSTYLYQFRRETGLVRERAEATISLCTEEGIAPHYLAHASILRGWAISTEGHTIEGITEMRRGLADLRAQGAEKDRPYFLGLLAEVYEQANQIEEGLDTLAQALHLIEQTGEHKWEAELHRLKGELLRSRAKTDQAEACFGEAIAVALRQEAKSFELRAAISLSRLWRQQGKHSEARGLLAPIYDWFTEGFDTADLREAKQELDLAT